MWSDNEADVDLLRFKYLASAVSRIIRTRHLLPTTIGVFGDWGSGKSSLLKMVQADLDRDPAIMWLAFNGWLFEGYEDAKTALMGTILDAIDERTSSSQTVSDKARALLDKLLKRVNWLQIAGLAGRHLLPAVAGLPQLSIATLGVDAWRALQATPSAVAAALPNMNLEDAQKLIKDAPDGPEQVRRNIRDFRQDFAALLKEAKIETLVVFIDDLDRCLPDTIIETLEAIKLFLFVPGTAFVLGADRRLVEYAVRQRFPELPGTETEVGRDYLEKLVQNTIVIPPLSGAEIESYISLLFAQLHLQDDEYRTVCEAVSMFTPTNITDLAFNLERARAILPQSSLPRELESDLDLTAQIAPVLTPGLSGNPRRTKRFLNTLLLRMSMSEDRGLVLQRRVLAKLMLLEYLRPDYFKQLAKLQAEQGGRPGEIVHVEGRLRKPRVIEDDAGNGTHDNGVAKESITTKSVSDTPRRSKEAAADEEVLPAELQPWLADTWMRVWLASEPSLSEIDLRPYFYIAHDTIGALTDSPLRLSPAATEVLNRLLSPKQVTQELGLTQAANLSGADANALFQSLAQRIRQAESLAQSPYKVLFRLMSNRPELMPQLVTLYQSLPEPKIILAIPPMLHDVTKDTPSAAAVRTMLERWSRSSKGSLANAARQILKRA